MPDIITVSDSADRLNQKTRALSDTIITITDGIAIAATKARAISETVTTSEQVLREQAKIRTITQTISITESLDRQQLKARPINESVEISDSVSIAVAKEVSKTLSETVEITEDTATQRAKAREITETTTITETLQAYKNDVELVPIIPIEIATPQNIIGTRQFKARAVPRAPRAIVIDEISNVAIAPLKVLAFAHEQNRIQTRLLLLTKPQAAISPIQVRLQEPKASIRSALKANLNPQPILLPVKVSSKDLIALEKQTARAKIRLSTLQSEIIKSHKPVNFDKMYKLTRIMKIAMLAESL